MAKKSNCTVHGKPMYRIRAQIGTDEHGKPVHKNFYGEGKKEAEAKRDAFLAKQKAGHVDTDASFGQLAKFYTYEILIHSGLAPGTITLYERQYDAKLRQSALMLRPISEITSADLQHHLNQLADGIMDGKPIKVSAASVRDLGKYLTRLFKWLQKQGYCDNLMLNVSVPIIKKTDTGDDDEDEVQTFTDDEIARIISTPNQRHFLFSLALATGLRAGELLALRYDDFVDGSVTVGRQISSHYSIDSDGYRELVTVVKKTKSSSSFRTVPVPASVLAELDAHRRAHKEEMLRNGYRTNYVFTTDSGKFVDRANLRRAWQRHLRQAEVPYKKFHACRSTYCTILCKNGVPLETASKLMGHSDINVTAKFYRLVSSSEKRDAAARIDHLFSGDGKPSGDELATK